VAKKIPAQEMLLDMLAGWERFVEDTRTSWGDAEIKERGMTREEWEERHSEAYCEAIADLYQEAGRVETAAGAADFIKKALLPFVLHGFKDKGG
jgi:hypothetical protein